MTKKTNKSKKLTRKTTKTPLSPEALKKLQEEQKFKMTHKEVNYGNVIPIALEMLSNMNRSLTELARDVDELKKLAKGG
jgi:hypothetical protein